jgi:hypothetical protein
VVIDYQIFDDFDHLHLHLRLHFDLIDHVHGKILHEHVYHKSFLKRKIKFHLSFQMEAYFPSRPLTASAASR